MIALQSFHKMEILLVHLDPGAARDPGQLACPAGLTFSPDSYVTDKDG